MTPISFDEWLARSGVSARDDEGNTKYFLSAFRGGDGEGNEGRIRGNDDQSAAQLLREKYDALTKPDEFGRLPWGARLIDWTDRGDMGTGGPITTADGQTWSRYAGSPEYLTNPYQDTLPGVGKQLVGITDWWRYDEDQGYLLRQDVANAVTAEMMERRANAGIDWFLVLVTSIIGAGAGAAAATVATAGGTVAAVGATTSTTLTAPAVMAPAAGEIAAGASSYALVPAGSSVGIGGVGTAGLGLQIPATLGGTAGGLGLASTGAATSALLSAELLAAAGVEALPVLTANQAAQAAAASGISAPASSSLLDRAIDWLKKPSVPSLPSSSGSPSTLGSLTNALKAGTAAVGAGTSLAKLLPGSSSPTGAQQQRPPASAFTGSLGADASSSSAFDIAAIAALAFAAFAVQ